MRRVFMIVAAIGVALLAGTGLWLLVAPGQLVKYPSDLNKTAVATGQFSLNVDTATGKPLARAQQLPLKIERNIKVVTSSGSQATVRERAVERIGPLPQQVLEQQYVMSRTSMKNIADGDAYAYTPGNLTDRSPYYAINLPLDTGKGPYEIWKNEVGRAYEFRQVGDPVKRDGLTLTRLEGTLTNAPVTSAFLGELPGQRLAKALTFQQLAAQLKAQGIDIQQLVARMLPEATPAQRAAIKAATGRAVPLQYVMSVRTRLLVEPKTGGIVAIERMDETLGAKPDLEVLAPVAIALGQSRLAANPAVKAAVAKLNALAQAPPAKVFGMSYGQTPASVADFAAYTKGKADDITLVKQTIPWVMGLAGVVMLLVGGGFWYSVGRGGPPAPEPPVVEPTVPAEPPRPRVPA
jgi:DUF3068 family protein